MRRREDDWQESLQNEWLKPKRIDKIIVSHGLFAAPDVELILTLGSSERSRTTKLAHPALKRGA